MKYIKKFNENKNENNDVPDEIWKHFLIKQFKIVYKETLFFKKSFYENFFVYL